MQKKSLLFFCFFVLSSLFLSAGESNKIDCNWFTDTKIWSLQVTEETINYYDFNQYKLGLGISGLLDMKELKVKTGLLAGNHQIKETGKLTYAPTLNEKWSPGILLQEHCCFDYGYYFEHDLLAGPFLEYRPNSFFTMNLSATFMQKFSYIFSLPENKKLVYNCCPAFYLDFYFYPLDWMFINFAFSSYSFYRYFLLLSPNTKLSFNFIANENLTIDIGAELQAVDYFTNSANYNTLVFSVGADWRF